MTFWQPYANAIKAFEGFSPRASWDYKQSSNGFGTRAKYPGEVVDRPTADARFDDEMGKAANIVNAFAPTAPDGTKAALTSLTYNAGDDWTKSGLGNAVKTGNWDEAKRLFVQYNRAGGKVLPGLADRRNAEVSWLGGQAPPADAPIPTMSSTLEQGPQSMPTQNGTYIPEDAIAQDYRFADKISNQNWSPTWAGVLAAGLGGLGGGMHRSSAQNALQSNQGMMSQALLNAGKATTPEAATSALISSGVPDLAKSGVEQKIKTLNDDPNKVYRVRAAQWQQLGNTPDTPGYKEYVLGGELAKPPTFTTVGEDQFGNKQYGFVDSSTQKVTPLQKGADATTPDAAPKAAELSGDEFLKTMPKPVADQIKAISEGRIAFPSGFALKTPYWQKMVQMLSQYDPNFDAVNYGSRSKTRNDFTAGKSAANIASFNTAIGHLDSLDKTVDDLGNSTSPLYNTAKNAVRGQFDTDYQMSRKKFDAARNAVASELTRAFRGTGGNVHDLQEWEHALNAADSPEALHAATRTAIDLLRSRIEAVGDQYNRGMGTTRDPLQLLSPHAQEVMARLEGLTQQAPTPTAVIPPTEAPPSDASEVDPRTVQPGQTFTYRGHTLKALGNGQFEAVQ